MSTSLHKKIAFNTIAQITGKVLGTIFGIFTIAIMTRYLGQTGFGEYTTIITFLSFFGILTDLGLTLTTAQMISKPGADEKKIMNNIFSLRVVTAIVFLSSAPIIGLFFPYPPIIKWGIALASISFFFTALFQVLIGVFQKYLITQKAAQAEVFTRFLLLLAIIFVAWFDWGLYGVLIAIIFSNFLQFILYYIYAKPYIAISWEIDWREWKKIWSITWPIFTTIAFNLVYFKTDTLFLSLFQSIETVGIYGAAYKVLEVVITLPFMFCGLLLPLLTQYWADKNKEKFEQLMQNGFDALSIFAIPMVFGTFILAKPLMIVISGEEFATAGPILQILIIATAIIFLNSLFSHAIIAINKQRAIIPSYIITAIIAIIGYIIFIPKYSLYGAAWMTVVTESIIALFIFITYKKTTRQSISYTVILKSLAAAILMYLFLFQFNYYLTIAHNAFSLLGQIILGAIIYLIFLYLFKGINKQTLSLIKK